MKCFNIEVIYREQDYLRFQSFILLYQEKDTDSKLIQLYHKLKDFLFIRKVYPKCL